MARISRRQLKWMVEELLTIRAVAERYKELEKQIKETMVEIGEDTVEVDGVGRVFTSTSERITIPVPLAIEVLGDQDAQKVIVTKRYVSNRIVEAFVDAGEIGEADYDSLLAGAERKPVVSLYVRPLK